MVRALQKISSALLVLILAIAMGWQGEAAVAVSASKQVCKCCDADTAQCATPACCARPADGGGVPASPVAQRFSPGTERLAIAAPSTALRVLPRATLPDPPPAPLSVQAG